MHMVLAISFIYHDDTLFHNLVSTQALLSFGKVAKEVSNGREKRSTVTVTLLIQEQ